MKTLVVVLCALTVVSALQQLYAGHKVFRVVPKTVEKLKWLQALPSSGMKVNVWTEPKLTGQPVDIQVAPEHINTLQTALDDLHMEYKIVIEDLQKLINSQSVQHETLRRKYNDKFVEWNYDRYLNLSEAHQWLEEQAAACGSTRCQLFDIGTSYENRRLPVIKISGQGGQAKPTSLWIDAGIHAREWISPAVAEYFVERLINDYGTDDDVTAILDRYDVYILIIMNPDGYEWTWTDDRLWRKSRQRWGTLCTGTDINRNFDFKWMEIGASDEPCSDTYAGPYAYSEPEALAVAEYVRNTSNIQWQLFLTLHSYSQLWMLPYGYTTTLIPTYDELLRVADIGAAALQAVNGAVYQTGAASEILYESSGTSRDWAYGVPSIPYVYTIELRDTGRYGFVLPPELILPSVTETWAGFKAAVIAIP